MLGSFWQAKIKKKTMKTQNKTKKDTTHKNKEFQCSPEDFKHMFEKMSQCCDWSPQGVPDCCSKMKK